MLKFGTWLISPLLLLPLHAQDGQVLPDEAAVPQSGGPDAQSRANWQRIGNGRGGGGGRPGRQEEEDTAGA